LLVIRLRQETSGHVELTTAAARRIDISLVNDTDFHLVQRSRMVHGADERHHDALEPLRLRPIQRSSLWSGGRRLRSAGRARRCGRLYRAAVQHDQTRTEIDNVPPHNAPRFPFSSVSISNRASGTRAPVRALVYPARFLILFAAACSPRPHVRSYPVAA